MCFNQPLVIIIISIKQSILETATIILGGNENCTHVCTVGDRYKHVITIIILLIHGCDQLRVPL